MPEAHDVRRDRRYQEQEDQREAARQATDAQQRRVLRVLRQQQQRRDRFAAAALTALIATTPDVDNGTPMASTVAGVCAQAWRWADRMLAEEPPRSE